jgi:hypothetical protein
MSNGITRIYYVFYLFFPKNDEKIYVVDFMSIFCEILHANSNKPVVVETVLLDVYVWESKANRISSVHGLWVVTLLSCSCIPTQCSFWPRQSSVPFPLLWLRGTTVHITVLVM